MKENKHPIRLEQVWFTRSVVIALQDHKPSDSALKDNGPENAINVAPIDGQEGRYQANMTTKLNMEGDPIFPYIIDMECIGVFTADISLPKEEALRAITITAHSVLFGAIREAVAWITGRHPFGQLMLGLSVLRSSPQEQPKK